MEQISNHNDYRTVIARIQVLSVKQESIFDVRELHRLQALAMDYESKRYDFTIGFADNRTLSAAG